VEEALDSLRYKDVRSTTLERLRLTWEADQRVQGLPQPLQLGEGLSYLLEHIETPVAAHDLLVGRITETVPNAKEEIAFQDILRGWNGGARPPWMRDGGHECFAWDRLLRHGLAEMEDYAGERASVHRGARADWLRGAALVYRALRVYARRYARAAELAGLEAAAARCGAIAEHPPATFAEALQLIWLVGHVYCTMVASNATLTFGRLDELLLPHYRRDMRRGTLTRDEAAALIADFYSKHNLILGRGEHQLGFDSPKSTGWQRNLCYDAPQYVVLGGRRADGAESANELTELFLEGIVPRFENPVVVLRYTGDLPGSVWQVAVNKMRQNASMMVYNDADVIPALERSGIAPCDAVTYTMHGCNWPDVPGVARTLRGNLHWLPRVLLEALMGTGDGPAPDLPDMAAVYGRLSVAFRDGLETECEKFREFRALRATQAPSLLRVDDCFQEGAIERACSWEAGAARYATLIVSLSGLATTVDALTALDDLVFTARQTSLDALRAALRADFGGAPDHTAEGEALLRQACLAAPKFGRDDDRADRHAVRLLNVVQDEIERARRRGAPDEVLIWPCLETDMNHIPAGRTLGATPDGRHAGEAVSENTSPTPGVCTRGLTAMPRSLAKLPLTGFCSAALNIRVSPGLVAGEDGLVRLASLLRTYLDMGGLQVQLSCADVDTLREAQRYPDAYRDLMVRITGYSAAFVDMEEYAQNEIIRREEMLAK
jgi:formate C-acetyltransferase